MEASASPIMVSAELPSKAAAWGDSVTVRQTQEATSRVRKLKCGACVRKAVSRSSFSANLTRASAVLWHLKMFRTRISSLNPGKGMK